MTAAALSSWEGAAVEQWRRRWRLPALIVLRETASTNDVARTLAGSGASAGLLVMAEHQHRGRGRMGRQWISAPGHALLLSFLLRPAAPRRGDAPGTVPIRVGLAVAHALHQSTGIAARVKWPNDVVVPGLGKLAGILCEAATAGGDTFVIAGIGINVRQQADDWPDELHDQATSIAIAARTAPDRAAIMTALCAGMRPLFTAPADPLHDDELRDYAALDALSGRAVTASGTDAARGIAAGIDSDGALLIDADGVTRRITSATVRPDDHAASTARPRP